jgi:hypothetical protein
MDDWKRGRVAALLVAIFVVSRLIARASGLQFDDSQLATAWQHLDVELLKHRLLESLYYLHSQPPLFNLFLGVVLKVAPAASAGSVFTALYFAMGAALFGAHFAVMRRLGVSRPLALVVATVFAVSPSALLYENWLFYTLPLALAITASALALARLSERRDLASSFLFASSLALLCLLQGIFHLAFFVVVMGGVALLRVAPLRVVALGAAAPFALVFALYAKNFVVFHKFTASTWMGMNIAVERIVPVPQAERERLVAAGTLPEVALKKPFLAPREYPTRLFEVPAGEEGVAAVSAPYKANGSPNYNHVGYIEVANEYLAASKYVVSHYPAVALRAIKMGWLTYFLSSTDYYYLQSQIDSSPLIRGEVWLYNHLFYGSMPGKGLCLVLVVGIPFVVAYAFYMARMGLRHAARTELRVAAAVAVYLAFVIAYVAITGNLLNAVENMRIRYMTDPAAVALFAWWAQRSLVPSARAWVAQLAPRKVAEDSVPSLPSVPSIRF